MGGTSPTYFHGRLTFYEARLLLDGIAMRERSQWEQTRLLADIIAKIAGNSNGTGIVFPWEEEDIDARQAPPTDEEYEELLKIKKEFENELNGNILRQ